ncbi:unnamed protein product [Chrysoparadoxa australica]
MGMVFGRTGLTQANGLSPAYEVLGTRSGFELRTYAPYVVAEVIGVEDDREGNNSFKYLAKYIGVFGTPENSNSEAMAMTAPVIKEPTEKIAMTAPVVREASGSGMVMSFVMPQKYTKISQLPAPTDSHVRLREVQQWSYLVKTFNGWVRDDGRKQLAELVGDIKADGTFAEVVDTEVSERHRDGEEPPTRQYEDLTSRLYPLISHLHRHPRRMSGPLLSTNHPSRCLRSGGMKFGSAFLPH